MEEDLRSSGAGLRGFKSHPRHHCFLIIIHAETFITQQNLLCWLHERQTE